MRIGRVACTFCSLCLEMDAWSVTSKMVWRATGYVASLHQVRVCSGAQPISIQMNYQDVRLIYYPQDQISKDLNSIGAFQKSMGITPMLRRDLAMGLATWLLVCQRKDMRNGSLHLRLGK